MKPDTEFDAYLTSQLNDASLPDGGFTLQVTARMGRDRRGRRLALAAAVALATVIVAIAVAHAPAPGFSLSAITPQSVIALLILISACSLVWIGTENARWSGR